MGGGGAIIMERWREKSINPIWPGILWSSWAERGGGLQKPHLHKSESIDAIDMKLGGYVEHY